MVEAQLEWDGVVLPLQNPTWENVLATARRLQGLDISNDFFVTYKDDEGDVINVKSDVDLKEAVRWAEEQRVACLCLHVPYSSTDSDSDESWTDVDEGLPATAQVQPDTNEVMSQSADEVDEVESAPHSETPPPVEARIVESETAHVDAHVVEEPVTENTEEVPVQPQAEEVQSVENTSEETLEEEPKVDATSVVELTPIVEVFSSASAPVSDLNPEKIIDLLYQAAENQQSEVSQSARDFLLELLSSSDTLEAMKQVLSVPTVVPAVVAVASSEKQNEGSAQKTAMTELIRLMYRDSTFLAALNKVPQASELVYQLFRTLKAVTPQQDQTPEVVSNEVVESKSAHGSVECDGCAGDETLRAQAIAAGFRNESGEICGVRYKSAVLPNFDLCELCEKDGRFDARAAPFLKIKENASAPEVIFCVMPGATQAVLRDHASLEWRNPVAQEFFEFLRSRQEEESQVASAVNTESTSSVTESPAESPAEPAVRSPPPQVAKIQLAQDLRCKHMLTRFVTPHGSYRCDVCNRSQPSRSVLFGCRVCNFDMCLDCRAARDSPTNLPLVPAPLPVVQVPVEAPRPVPQAKFVSDVTLADGSTVRQNEFLVKVWRVRNSGAEVWPVGTRIAHVGGDPFGGPMEGVEVPLANPGSVVDISVPLVMPNIPGRYTSYWRLMTPHPQNAKFGHRFWVTVNVVSGDPRPAPMPQVTAWPERLPQLPVPLFAQLPGSPPVFAPHLRPTAPPAPAPVASDPVVPDEYVEAVSQMVELGFTDLEKVVRVLKEVNGNTAQAIERLLEDA